MTQHPIEQAIIDEYIRRTPQSRMHCEAAARFLPGGDTRRSVFFLPYPTYIERGDGCTLTDVDGNRYLDFNNNYTSLIHGHGHPAVVEAVRTQVAKGTLYGSPTTCQYELGGMLCDRIPSLERVRFCNSGTEATMMAMRLARAYSGKDVILKMDGGYHGTHDFAEVNITAYPDSGIHPPLHKESRGIPDCILDAMMVVPFNNLDAVEEILSAYNHRIAALIVEPMMNAGGLVAPQDGYLKGLRELATKYGVLLIFDEVVTFRLAAGGWQQMEKIMPDITTLGKIIGGGTPVGALGGKADIMEMFNPNRPDSVKHSGTFNGNSITMVAGIATLQHFGQSEIDYVNDLGNKLRRGIAAAFRTNDLHVNVTGRGSLAYIHWTANEIVNASDSARAAKEAGKLLMLLQLGLLNHGIWLPYRGELAVSTPMTEREIDQAAEALNDTLKLLKPYVEDNYPHLLLSS
ncbi:MAG: aspartate aminotransferase family protein [Anaerolineales bacterium]|nr:aspartate aminotransferase family protein [Anaerolineales bacterium]